MIVHNKEMEKMTVIIVLAVILSCGCTVLFSDSSLAQNDESRIEQIDPVKITIEGKEETVDAFKYLGVIYAVTSDVDHEEEVGVYGVDKDYTGSVYIVVCSFGYGEEDDAITYLVTNVLSEFSYSEVNKPLVMADTVTDFGKGCFENLNKDVVKRIYITNDCGDIEKVRSDTGYEFIDNIKEIETHVTLSFDKGDVAYPQDKYKNQSMDDLEIFLGITTMISACSFENPYYDFDGWLMGDEIVADDCSSITYYGDKIYIDGKEFMDAKDLKLTASWVEADYDESHEHYGDYPITYMYVTSAIIIILFIVGFASLGYRIYNARKA